MPYFQWQGISLQGQIKRGKLFAQSAAELDALLLKREIALLKSREISYGFFEPSIKPADIIHFLRAVSTLLKAGLLLPDVLLMVSEQIKHPRFQGIVYTLAVDVHKGIPLSQAMSNYPQLFDELVVHMAHVGQETGSLDSAFIMACEQMEILQGFRKKLHSAALMPSITFIFFLLMALIIFMVIIPHFADIFKAMNQELPAVSRYALRMSEMATLKNVAVLLIVCVVVLASARLFFARASARRSLDRMLLKLPYIGIIIQQSSLIYFLRSAAMLVDGGVPLVSALNGACKPIKNSEMREHCRNLAEMVEAGSSLSESLMHDELFDQELRALVKVGEESGQLGAMLSKAAQGYQDKVSHSLFLCTTLFQPLCMIIMGLLITGLIFAVYLPIFSLAHVIA